MGQHMTKNDKMFLHMIKRKMATRGFKVSEEKGGAIAGIRQGTEEQYQELISRLEEAIYRMLPPSEGTDMLLKQLA